MLKGYWQVVLLLPIILLYTSYTVQTYLCPMLLILQYDGHLQFIIKKFGMIYNKIVIDMSSSPVTTIAP